MPFANFVLIPAYKITHHGCPDESPAYPALKKMIILVKNNLTCPLLFEQPEIVTKPPSLKVVVPGYSAGREHNACRIAVR